MLHIEYRYSLLHTGYSDQKRDMLGHIPCYLRFKPHAYLFSSGPYHGLCIGDQASSGGNMLFLDVFVPRCVYPFC